MIQASSRETIKTKFAGIRPDFEADEKHELDYDTFRAEIEKKA